MPLYFISVLGGGIMAVAALSLIVSLCAGQLLGELQMSLVIVSAVALFCGVQVFCTGVVAAYLAKVLDETRARPTYLVGAKLGQGFMRNSDAAITPPVSERNQQLKSALEKAAL